MSTAIERPTDFTPGRDYPSPVTHVIGLGYYDGVTDGVLKTRGGSVYRFETTEEEFNPDGLDRRTYLLTSLPAVAFDAVVDALTRHHAPNWPCWVPVWLFPTEGDRTAVEGEVDRWLATTRPPTWVVTAEDITDTVSSSAAS